MVQYHKVGMFSRENKWPRDGGTHEKSRFTIFPFSPVFGNCDLYVSEPSMGRNCYSSLLYSHVCKYSHQEVRFSRDKNAFNILRGS